VSSHYIFGYLGVNLPLKKRCYLFSAFSIKKNVSKGVSEDQLAVMNRWRRTILNVANEEMTHMALACNLLT